MDAGDDVIRAAVQATFQRDTAVIRCDPRHFSTSFSRSRDGESRRRLTLGERWTKEYFEAGEPRLADLSQTWGGGLSVKKVARQQWRLGAYDFGRQRSVRYDEGQGWVVFAAAATMIGQDGRWERLAVDPAEIMWLDPLWLLAAMAGTVSAAQVENEHTPPGWTSYAGLSDPEAVSDAFGRSLGRVPSPPQDDAGRIRFVVLLDTNGLIRRASLDRAHPAIELGDFGAPITINLPADGSPCDR